MSDAFFHLPYRPCVGVVLVNRQGLVFAGARSAPEGGAPDANQPWQMPQGGIDKGEEPLEAAIRELREETDVRAARLLMEAPDWLHYDLPKDLIGVAWKGKYRGQTQKWFAFRFEGDDGDINILNPDGGHKAEFSDWRWMPLTELADVVVAFKRPVYRHLVDIFAPILKAG
jgi:putative (di)nucleoside polyphosphate hydrolase